MKIYTPPFQHFLILMFTLTFAQFTHAQTPASFQSVNFPGHYIRHANYLGYLNPIKSELDRKDASFVLVPNPFVNGATFIKPAYFPQHYLRHQNYELKISQSDDSDVFFKDASFYIRSGLNGQGISLESVNYPGYFIRHQNFQLYIHPNDGTELFRKDATFTQHGAAIPQNYMQSIISEQQRVNQIAQPQQAQLQEQQSQELEQQRLAQQRAQQEQQRIAQQQAQAEQQRAQAEQQRIAQQRAQEEQQRQLQEQQQRDKTFTVRIDCKGYGSLTNTNTNDYISVSFVNRDGTKLSNSSTSKVVNNCDLDAYYHMTSPMLMNEVVAVQIITSGSDGFWMDKVMLYGDNQEIAHWGENEGKGYCLSNDPADANGSWRDFVGSRGCQPCFRFDVASGQVVSCQ